eukprot:2087570-Prymnesium_polylepis.1
MVLGGVDPGALRHLAPRTPTVADGLERWANRSRLRLSLIGGGFSAAAACCADRLIAMGLNSIPTRAPAPDPP